MRTKLQRLADKHDGITAEIVSVDKAAPELRAQAETMIADLAEKIPAETLILLDPNSPDLDDETKFAVATLSGVRLKLELLPGVRSRLHTSLTQIRSEIASEQSALRTEYLQKGRDKIAELEALLTEQLLPICGGDSHRTKLAVAAVIEQCEAAKWLQVLRTYSDTPEAVRTYLGYVSRFDAGENVQ